MAFQFEIAIKLVGDGLLGGIHERDPYLAVHDTFGELRVPLQVPLVLCDGGKKSSLTNHERQKQPGNFDYDAAQQDQPLHYKTEAPLRFKLHMTPHTRGDEAIWFELWCHTRNSGLAEIDAREARHVDRHISCGLFPLEIYTLLQQHTVNTNQTGKLQFSHSVCDDKIVAHKLQEYVQRDGIQLTEQNHRQYAAKAMAETHKGVMHFEVDMRQFDAQLYQHTLFGRRHMKRDHLCATMPLGDPHQGLYVDDEGALRWGGPRIKKRDVHWRDNKGREHHHKTLVVEAKSPDGTALAVKENYSPVLYNSEKGVQAMMRAMEHHVLMPYARHFMQLEHNGPAPLIRPLNAQIAQLQMPMWMSKMGQAPTYAYWSCHCPTTREYANEEMRQRELDRWGYSERTEQLLLTLLKSALRRHGLSREAFEREIGQHFSLQNKSRQLSPLLRECEKVLADAGTYAANSANYTADFRFVTEHDKKGRRFSHMIVLDSWDNTILNNCGNSDDCEGLQNTASTIIRAYATGRHTLGFAWESSLLNAAQLLLRHTVIYDVGATVTSAYMDANHKKIDMKKAKDLPMIGDQADLDSECGGHCHGLWEPLTVSYDRLRNGNTPADVLKRVEAAIPACPDFQARDRLRQSMVLEATSSIEPYILPLKETYAGQPQLLKKEQAKRQFVKALRARLDARRAESATGAGSDQMKPGLADLGDLLGGEGMPYYVEQQHPQRRISTFYNEVVHGCSMELARYDTSLAQIAFCRRVQGRVVGGAKIADLLRNRADYALMTPFSENRTEWQQQVLPMVESLQHQLPLAAFGRYTEEQQSQVSSHHYWAGADGKSAAEFEALVHTVAENPGLAVVPLYSKEWKLLENKSNTTQLREFIAQLPGQVTHAYYKERHLPVCEDAMMDILCVIDVEVCLTLKLDSDASARK